MSDTVLSVDADGFTLRVFDLRAMDDELLLVVDHRVEPGLMCTVARIELKRCHICGIVETLTDWLKRTREPAQEPEPQPPSDTERELQRLRNQESKLSRQKASLREVVLSMTDKNAALKHKIRRLNSYIAKLKGESVEQPPSDAAGWRTPETRRQEIDAEHEANVREYLLDLNRGIERLDKMTRECGGAISFPWRRLIERAAGKDWHNGHLQGWVDIWLAEIRQAVPSLRQ